MKWNKTSAYNKDLGLFCISGNYNLSIASRYSQFFSNNISSR